MHQLISQELSILNNKSPKNYINPYFYNKCII